MIRIRKDSILLRKVEIEILYKPYFEIANFDQQYLRSNFQYFQIFGEGHKTEIRTFHLPSGAITIHQFAGMKIKQHYLLVSEMFIIRYKFTYLFTDEQSSTLIITTI